MKLTGLNGHVTAVLAIYWFSNEAASSAIQNRRQLCVEVADPPADPSRIETDVNLCRPLPGGKLTLTTTDSIIAGIQNGPIGGPQGLFIYHSDCHEICHIDLPAPDCGTPFQLQCAEVSMTIQSFALSQDTSDQISFTYGAETYDQCDCEDESHGTGATTYCRCEFAAPITPNCGMFFNDFTCGSGSAETVDSLAITDGDCHSLSVPLTALNVDAGCVGANSINVYANPDCTGQEAVYNLDEACYNPGFFIQSVKMDS